MLLVQALVMLRREERKLQELFGLISQCQRCIAAEEGAERIEKLREKSHKGSMSVFFTSNVYASVD